MAASASLVAPPDSLRARLGRGLHDANYTAQRTGFALLSRLFMEAFHRMLRPEKQIPPREQRQVIQRRFVALLRRDLANAEAGHYPGRLLFETGLRDYLKAVPTGVLDIPRVLRRARREAFDDLPDDVELERYPRYYRRTFHWQSDGWLSDRSARLYDPGVELLFGGTADVMRRMLLPDLGRDLRAAAAPRVLDLGCGTGRFFRQLHAAIPRARLFGLDLSPHYLRYARDMLRQIDDVSLVAGNAEATPFAADHFDAVTAIYLFHELPKDARRNVMREALRVLRPGGTFAVLCSTQYRESSEMRWFLDAFPRFYHEPYYKGYLRDPVEDALAECGFEIVDARVAFVSKVVIARAPA